MGREGEEKKPRISGSTRAGFIRRRAKYPRKEAGRQTGDGWKAMNGIDT